MLLRYKKLISCLLIFFILDINIVSVDAVNIFMDAMPSENDENIEIDNINIKYDENDEKHYITVKDISKGTGCCFYKDIDVDKINVKFYHKLSTVAYKEKIGNDTEYFLGCNEGNDYYPVKYLPNDEKYGDLKDGLYIKNDNKSWRKCSYEDEKYIFKKLDDTLTEKLKSYKTDLLDYGLNIYVSKDGDNFKKLKPAKVLIRKETQSIDDSDNSFSAGTDIYLEEMEFKNIPNNTKYIKIKLNEASSLIDSSEPLMSIYEIKFNLRNIKMGISEEDVEEKNKKTRKIGISNENILDEDDNIFGNSEETEQVVYKFRTKKSKSAPKKRIIRVDENGNILGSSRNNVRKSNDESIIYKYKRPINKKISKKVKYIDPEKNNKIDKNKWSSYSNKDRSNNKYDGKIQKNNDQSRAKSKSDFVNNITDDDQYDKNFKEYNNGVSFNNKNLNKNKKRNQRSKRNIEKNIDKDLIISDDIKINNDPDNLIEFITERDNLVSQDSQYEDQDEIYKEEKQIKTEKTVSKIYLSGLFVTLGSILTYDKIGLIRKFLKF